MLLRRLVLRAFGLLYNELAWTYDLVAASVSMGQWRSWQRAALPYLRGRRVLEVGHGTGNLLLDLASLGFQPVGVDLSARMGRLAGRKLRRALGGPELPVPLVRASVDALPFAAGTVPSVLSTFPTEYIGRSAAIAEFYRVLAPGGILVSVPAAQITGLGLGDRLADWLFRLTGQAAVAGRADPFDPLLQRYADAGFVARVEYVRLPRSRVSVIVAEKR